MGFGAKTLAIAKACADTRFTDESDQDPKQNFMENLNLSNSCVNCENLLTNSLCGLHKIEVNEKYTCDSFENK